MDTIAVRYASALLSIAVDENKVTDYKVAMEEILSAFKENPDLSILLSSAFIHVDEKRATIDRLFGHYGLVSLTSFIKIIVEHKRIHDFANIGMEFIEFANVHLGIEEGVIYSTLPISKEKMAEIEKVLSETSHKKVQLKNEIDLSLIGGIKVVIHDRLYDGSVSSMLSSLQTELLKRKVINREN